MLTVLIPNQGEIAYRRAGEAFRDMAEKVTGTRPEITETVPENGDIAVIGSDSVNDFTAKAFAEDLIDSLGIRYGTDDYAIRSVRQGERRFLFLAGGCGRSTLYAVYDYFERFLGCHYYWDGDVIPHAETLPLDVDAVTEKPRFEYRGLRYFAHRGLHRYQAEHWSLADWKTEIDWLVKRRMNYFMLRIGMDDLFQKAFPDTVDYPCASERLPEAGDGYDDRTLFWPLEFRGMLRKQVLSYARERGLMHSEDFGTMTHWYSRTPIQYLEKKRPVLLDQVSSGYKQQTGLCWDPRVRENLDNYMKITDAFVKEYGSPELFHTIGLAERFICEKREDDMKIKRYTYRRTLQRIREKYPQSRQLLAAWDFLRWWQPQEVKNLIAELDPEHQIILDYMCEFEDPGQTFLTWDVIGKFPWIVGIFHAYECMNDIRGQYDITKERLETASADPFCRGMVLWPELSHSDTLMLEYLARNSWKPESLTVEELAERFSRERYGTAGARMNGIWQHTLPVTKLVGWGTASGGSPEDADRARFSRNYRDNRVYLMDMLHADCLHHPKKENLLRWEYVAAKAREVLPDGIDALRGIAALGDADAENPFVKRDAVDIAQSLTGRLSHFGVMKLCLLRHEFEEGKDTLAEAERLIGCLWALSGAMAEILGCHRDYSMAETLEGLGRVCPVNPVFEPTLKRNLVNGYCRQAAYEPYRELFMAEQRTFYDWVLENMRAGRRGDWDASPLADAEERLFARFMEKPLAEMRPTGEGDVRVPAGKATELLGQLVL